MAMPVLAQPWRLVFGRNEEEQEEERAMDMVKQMTLRRASTKEMDFPQQKEDDPVKRILLRLEGELKGRLSELDRKLERLCASSAASSGHRPSRPMAMRLSNCTPMPPMPPTQPPQPLRRSATAEEEAGRESTLPNTPSPSKTGSAELLGPHVQSASSWLEVPGGSRMSLTPRSVGSRKPLEELPGRESVKSSTSLPRASLRVLSRGSLMEDLVRQKIVGSRDHRSSRAHEVWQLLENPDSGPAAFWLSRAMLVLVLFNVAFSLEQSQEKSLLEGNLPVILQLLFDLLCTIEVCIRFLVCPNRLLFFTGFFNCVDLLPIIGFGLRLHRLVSAEADIVSIDAILHCTMPVVWLLKLLRNFEKFHLLLSAFSIAFEALPVLLFTLTILILIFAALIFAVEPEVVFLPQAVWFATVTLMTVGYGDIVPKSSPGLLITSSLMIAGGLYMAIPLGIVGGSFSRVWEDRDRFLLVRRTRLRLSQWGYTPADLLELFYHYDKEEAGVLDLPAFQRLMLDLRLGLSAERVHKLFRSLDHDSSGFIDDEEFLTTIFPHTGLYSLGLRPSWLDPGSEASAPTAAALS